MMNLFPRFISIFPRRLVRVSNELFFEPMATLLDFLTERDQYYPIYELLSSHLRIAEIIALTRTCRKLSHLYQELLPVFWDIDWFLRRFVDDPYEFRGQMKQHNAFLSGQFAYGFFKGEPGEGRPIMDILIHVRDRDAFVQYLLQVEGYEIGTPGHGDVDEVHESFYT